jgi:hypothetical protein
MYYTNAIVIITAALALLLVVFAISERSGMQDKFRDNNSETLPLAMGLGLWFIAECF